MEPAWEDSVAIDMDTCRSCGSCARECPLSPSGIRVDHADDRCLRCLHCYAVCPQEAITLAGDDIPEGVDERDRAAVEPDDLRRFLAERRSARHFTSAAVSHELVETIMDAARHVPSGGNRHGHEFTVIESAALRRALRSEVQGFYRSKRDLLKNAVVRWMARRIGDKKTRAFLRDPRYSRILDWQIGGAVDGPGDFAFFDAPVVVLVHSKEEMPTPDEDSVLAGYNIALMAQACGLGSCFVSLAKNAINSSKKCKAAAGLPPDHRLYCVVVLGSSETRFRRSVPRKLRAEWRGESAHAR
jgi:nitroreductase/Pyruvate/2-oxoacid:ferredoxin oxidoreductase delta subunit